VLIRIIDSNAGVTSLGYDPENRLVQKTDQNKNSVGFTRDGAGGITGVTDGLGNIQRVELNGMGQIVTAYDAYSNVISENYYDSRGLLEENSDGQGRTLDWNYDKDRLLTQTQDGLGNVTSFVTDGLGRFTQATDPLLHTTKQSFDLDGNRISLTNALNRSVQFGYDPGDRVSER
jgi:YD repeat-containing protein